MVEVIVINKSKEKFVARIKQKFLIDQSIEIDK